MNFWDWAIWDGIFQFGFLALLVFVSNMIRRKIPILKKSLIPSALIGGIIALILKSVGWLDFIDINFLEGITYHAVALGFICLALKQNYGARKDPSKEGAGLGNGISAGATIAGTMVMQAIIGLAVTCILGLFVGSLFKGSGILLGIGFGQGPGQSNNFGKIFDTAAGYTDGSIQSFALSIASIGTLIGSIIAVIFLNIMKRRGKVKLEKIESSLEDVEQPQADEMSLNEPVDRLTMNVGTIMIVFLATCGFLWGFDTLFIQSGLMGNFGVNTIRPLMFGFNFIFGLLFAQIYKKIYIAMKKKKLITHEYTNNTTLTRIAGLTFDFMLVASVIIIDIKVMGNLILPLVLICTFATVADFFYLRFICKKLAKGYEMENFMGMFGNLHGTISTGIANIRLIDPNFKTPASNNLVVGSSFAVVLGFPLMLLLTLAQTHPWLTLGLLVVFFIGINLLLFRQFIFKNKSKHKNTAIESKVTSDMTQPQVDSNKETTE